MVNHLTFHFGRNPLLTGRGYLAGEAPAVEEPGAPDGRAKIHNVPSRLQVTVYSSHGMRPVERVLSKPDGTWRVDHLNASASYTVIGRDGRGLVNAAIQDWVRPHVPEP